MYTPAPLAEPPLGGELLVLMLTPQTRVPLIVSSTPAKTRPILLAEHLPRFSVFTNQLILEVQKTVLFPAVSTPKISSEIFYVERDRIVHLVR
jgi:hypothetical protein